MYVRGRRSFGREVTAIYDPHHRPIPPIPPLAPTGLLSGCCEVSSGIQGDCPQSTSCGRGTACTGSASCSHSRTTACHHGAERCGQRHSLTHTFPRKDTSRTTDACGGKPCLLSATCSHTLCLLLRVCLDAEPCVPHSTVRLSGWDSRGDCTVALLSLALPFTPFHTTKALTFIGLQRLFTLFAILYYSTPRP